MHNPTSLLKALGEELLRAIALTSLWDRCANAQDILVPINEGDLQGFSLVRDAIHKDLVLTLTKIYDKGADDLSFPRIFRALETTNLNSVIERARYYRAKAKYDVVTDEVSGIALRSLKRLRDKVLAHTDTRKKKQTAIYRHQRIVLEASIEIYVELSAALAAHAERFEVFTEDWNLEADRFWKALAAGLSSDEE